LILIDGSAQYNFRPIAAQPLADVVHWLRQQTAPATADK
jgi:hypothetical protein